MIGNLVIIFDIEFPNVLTNVQIDALGIRELIKKKKLRIMHSLHVLLIIVLDPHPLCVVNVERLAHASGQ